MPEAMFESCLRQTLIDENRRAEKLKDLTRLIHVAHLLCMCGKPVKDQLIQNLRRTTFSSLGRFMSCLLRPFSTVGNDIIEDIKDKANCQKVHPVVVFVDYLIKNLPNVTLSDIISCLQDQFLFRVIAGFDVNDIYTLIRHAKHTSSHTVCCSVQQVHLISGGTETIKGVLLLTFLEDGINHAKQLKKSLERPSRDCKRYIVYTLLDFNDSIEKKGFSEIFQILLKVDYVVPVLTDKYYEMLADLRAALESDDKFTACASFVAKIMLDNWASKFENWSVRCYKPKDVVTPLQLIPSPFLRTKADFSALVSSLIRRSEG